MQHSGLAGDFASWLFSKVGQLFGIFYAGMMIVSYLTGQKNYPVPYNVAEIFTYLTVALIIYFAGLGINKMWAPEGFVHWLLQTALLAAFVLIIYLIEKPKHQFEKTT